MENKDKKILVINKQAKPKRTPSVQTVYLNDIKDDKSFMNIYLINGLKLFGYIQSYDNYVVTITSPKCDKPMMIYKHAIASIEYNTGKPKDEINDGRN